MKRISFSFLLPFLFFIVWSIICLIYPLHLWQKKTFFFLPLHLYAYPFIRSKAKKMKTFVFFSLVLFSLSAYAESNDAYTVEVCANDEINCFACRRGGAPNVWYLFIHLSNQIISVFSLPLFHSPYLLISLSLFSLIISFLSTFFLCTVFVWHA